MTLVKSCRRPSETQTLVRNSIFVKMNTRQKKTFSHEKFHPMKNCSRDNMWRILAQLVQWETPWERAWIGLSCCGSCGGDIGRYLISIDVFHLSFGRKILFGCYKVKNSTLGLERRLKLSDRQLCFGDETFLYHEPLNDFSCRLAWGQTRHKLP